MSVLKVCIEKYCSLPTLTKASLWFLVCSFIQKGISVISTPIFTRLLTPEEYGLFQCCPIYGTRPFVKGKK